MEEVDSPVHYRGHGMEVIEVIEAFGLGFNLGNVIKYLLRAGKKGSLINDLHKAKWYIDRELLMLGSTYEKGVSEEVKEGVPGYDWSKGGQCEKPLAPI